MSEQKITESEIINRIADLYPDAVIDATGEDCSFEIYVISERFDGVSLLQRQKTILGLFKDELSSGKLHALSVKAKTPQEQNAASGLVQIQTR